jgi:hypothetical protein
MNKTLKKKKGCVNVLYSHRQFGNAHHCGLTALLVDIDVSQMADNPQRQVTLALPSIA